MSVVHFKNHTWFPVAGGENVHMHLLNTVTPIAFWYDYVLFSNVWLLILSCECGGCGGAAYRERGGLFHFHKEELLIFYNQ